MHAAPGLWPKKITTLARLSHSFWLFSSPAAAAAAAAVRSSREGIYISVDCQWVGGHRQPEEQPHSVQLRRNRHRRGAASFHALCWPRCYLRGQGDASFFSSSSARPLPFINLGALRRRRKNENQRALRMPGSRRQSHSCTAAAAIYFCSLSGRRRRRRRSQLL